MQFHALFASYNREKKNEFCSVPPRLTEETHLPRFFKYSLQFHGGKRTYFRIRGSPGENPNVKTKTHISSSGKHLRPVSTLYQPYNMPKKIMKTRIVVPYKTSVNKCFLSFDFLHLVRTINAINTDSFLVYGQRNGFVLSLRTT